MDRRDAARTPRRRRCRPRRPGARDTTSRSPSRRPRPPRAARRPRSFAAAGAAAWSRFVEAGARPRRAGRRACPESYRETRICRASAGPIDARRSADAELDRPVERRARHDFDLPPRRDPELGEIAKLLRGRDRRRAAPRRARRRRSGRARGAACSSSVPSRVGIGAPCGSVVGSPIAAAMRSISSSDAACSRRSASSWTRSHG